MSRRRTGYAIVAVLIAASLAAFARAEQLKLARSPVGSPRIQTRYSPVCAPGPRCTSNGAVLSFRLRQPARLRLEMVGPGGTVVRTFMPAAGRPFRKGRVWLRWNGRTGAGALVPDGTYHLRVDLLSLGRRITIPSPLVIDTVPPVVTLESSPGATPVRYHSSQPGFTELRLIELEPAGRVRVLRVIRGHAGVVRVPLRWHGRGLRMQLRAVDDAGNVSLPVAAGTLG